MDITTLAAAKKYTNTLIKKMIEDSDLPEVLSGKTIQNIYTYSQELPEEGEEGDSKITVAVKYTDDTIDYFDFTVENGMNGVGIKSIEKTSTNGLVDTYTITLTDNRTQTFTITNSKDGKEIVSVSYEILFPETPDDSFGTQGSIGKGLVFTFNDGSKAQVLLPEILEMDLTMSETEEGIEVLYKKGQTISVYTVRHGKDGAVGPQGKQGPQGEKGDKGDKGDTGLQGVQGIQGEKGADGSDYVLTSADKEEIASMVTVVSDDTGIPTYWMPALEEGAEAINVALTTAGYNKSAFMFYSDAHLTSGSQMSPKLLKYLYEHTGMTKTFFGGDVVDNESTDYDGMKYLWDWRNQLKGLPNHHSVVGNHDDGNATNNLFSEQYVYGYLLSAEETPDIVRDNKGMYYYIDNSPEKTRYIFLDTAYKGMNSDQIAFLKEALIGTKEGWHIVVISHIWYMPDYDRYNERPIPIVGLSSDASTVTTMLDNYNSRSGDYADCKGWVEFCIGGHIHYDYDATTSTGIPIILVETDSSHTRGNYTYTAETTTEASVNGIIADYDNHKIYIVRIGRGESREVTVTNYQVTYTNVIPTALDADGTSVYNGIGYKTNTRWSSSSNAEQTADGVYLTGYIPVSNNDVIRLKNITMPNEQNNHCLVFFTDTPGTVAASNNNGGLTQYNKAVWDENNNLIQFTTEGYSYIRIQCGDINDASIITINEPIE
jgi:hypothetical protein